MVLIEVVAKHHGQQHADADQHEYKCLTIGCRIGQQQLAWHDVRKQADGEPAERHQE